MPTPVTESTLDPDGPATVRVNVPVAAAVDRTPIPSNRLSFEERGCENGTTEAFPVAGQRFLGFDLIEELGRGAFGRVFLANQGDLAGRPVALKVARDLFGESRTLAQLQHSHIVPIYSYHRFGSLQAVCMPYLGRTTLADVLERFTGRDKLPSSARELKSTVNRFVEETLPSKMDSTKGPHAPPLPTLAPAPSAEAPPEGWERVEGLSFVEAVLVFGSQLAEGLAHAHRRGIIHRDIKPANVLLTDDGRPMLLDFNLAEDTKPTASAERSAAGGTLPYMAPEQIRQLLTHDASPDARADLFALGVILFELLTGRHPYTTRRGSWKTAAGEMYTDRRGVPPSPRAINPAVPPAVDSIVRTCLAPNPDDRYPTADLLRADFERQLAHRPLAFAPNPCRRERFAKWVKRHPKLTSGASVAGLAAGVVIAAVGVGYAAVDRVRTHEAVAGFADHRTRFADMSLALDDRGRGGVSLETDVARVTDVLATYRVKEGEPWLAADAVRRLPVADRDRLKAEMGEAYFRLAERAYLGVLGSTRDADRAIWLDRAESWHASAARLAGPSLPVALAAQRRALDAARDHTTPPPVDPTSATTPRDLALLGGQLAREGRTRESLAALRKATQLDPKDFSAWFVRGTSHLSLDQNELAIMCFGAALALRPDSAPAWRNRGLAFAHMRFYEQALADYDRATALDPHEPEHFLQRAVVHDARNDLAAAEADYTLALDRPTVPVRAYFLRADVRARRGDTAGATKDREVGLRATPADELSWIGRAELRVETDPAAALLDVEEALKQNPFSLPGLQMKAHILGERLKSEKDALAVLDRAVELYPEAAAVRAGRGVLRARKGNRDAALADARDAALLDTKAPNLYQVGCIYALTAKSHPDDRVEALRYLWSGLRQGFGLDLVDGDNDLDPIRPHPDFKAMVAKAKAAEKVMRGD